MPESDRASNSLLHEKKYIYDRLSGTVKRRLQVLMQWRHLQRYFVIYSAAAGGSHCAEHRSLRKSSTKCSGRQQYNSGKYLRIKVFGRLKYFSSIYVSALNGNCCVAGRARSTVSTHEDCCRLMLHSAESAGRLARRIIHTQPGDMNA